MQGTTYTYSLHYSPESKSSAPTHRSDCPQSPAITVMIIQHAASLIRVSRTMSSSKDVGPNSESADARKVLTRDEQDLARERS